MGKKGKVLKTCVNVRPLSMPGFPETSARDSTFFSL